MTTIRTCTKEDILRLSDISAKTFVETFYGTTSDKNLEAFLKTAYHPAKLEKEMDNPDSTFYFTYVDDELAGYLKINLEDAQTEIHDPVAGELERIYVQKNFQGRGVGRFLMEQALKLICDAGKEYIWLGVWEHNKRALNFYKGFGFYQICSHDFPIGDDIQTDIILRKDFAYNWKDKYSFRKIK